MAVELERDGEVALLRLERPPVNALDVQLLEDIVAAVAELDRSDARAAVLTGSGKAFSAGVDLFAMLDGGEAYVRRLLPALSEAFAALFTTDKPVVAALNGHAIAGGCILAAACDLRLMAQGSGRIGVTELPVGVPFPAWALEIVRFATPAQHLQQMVLRGQTYPPDEARALGLVDEVVPADLIGTAMERARELAAIPAATFAHTKRQLRAPTVERVEAARGTTDAAAEALWSSADTADAIRGYLDARVRKRS